MKKSLIGKDELKLFTPIKYNTSAIVKMIMLLIAIVMTIIFANYDISRISKKEDIVTYSYECYMYTYIVNNKQNIYYILSDKY